MVRQACPESIEGLTTNGLLGYKTIMSKILILYRREDSADVTGRIYDWLIQVFPQLVFRDVDSIPLGIDFRAYFDEQVAK
ncbi:MAG: hypothetical protein U0223_17395 [Nitrospira sp.]|nr:hypothetical protein [Nitrospira sp.]